MKIFKDFSDNQKTMKQENYIIVILKCIWCIWKTKVLIDTY